MRIGIFCKFGSVDDNLPVAATVCWKFVWILPSLSTALIRPSIVDINLLVSRILNRCLSNGCFVFPANHSKLSASVVKPVLIFFVFGSLNSSNKTTCSCFGEPTLNSCPASLYAIAVSSATIFVKCADSWFSFARSTAMPISSIWDSSSKVGCSKSSYKLCMPLDLTSAVSSFRNANIQAACLGSKCEKRSSELATWPKILSARSLKLKFLLPGLHKYANNSISDSTPDSPKFFKAIFDACRYFTMCGFEIQSPILLLRT